MEFQTHKKKVPDRGLYLPHPPDLGMSLCYVLTLLIWSPEMKCSLPSHVTVPSVISSPCKKSSSVDWSNAFIQVFPPLGWSCTWGASIWIILPYPQNLVSTAFPRAGPTKGCQVNICPVLLVMPRGPWYLLFLWFSLSGYFMSLESSSEMWRHLRDCSRLAWEDPKEGILIL